MKALYNFAVWQNYVWLGYPDSQNIICVCLYVCVHVCICTYALLYSMHACTMIYHSDSTANGSHDLTHYEGLTNNVNDILMVFEHLCCYSYRVHPWSFPQQTLNSTRAGKNFHKHFDQQLQLSSPNT